jgi:hypothetical protein
MVDENEARRTDCEGEDDRHQDEEETARLAGHDFTGRPKNERSERLGTRQATGLAIGLPHEGLIHWTGSGSSPTFTRHLFVGT